MSEHECDFLLCAFSVQIGPQDYSWYRRFLPRTIRSLNRLAFCRKRYTTGSHSAGSLDMWPSHSNSIAIPRNNSFLECPRRNMFLREENVKLLKCPLTCFWKAEVSPDKGYDCKTCGQEPCLPFPVAGGGVENVRRDNRVDDVQNEISSASQGDGLGSKPCRADLAVDDVRQWPESQTPEMLVVKN